MGLSDIRDRVARAAAAADRNAEDIALIAVSKLQPADRIEAVLGQGHRLFGENRVQEAAARWPALIERFAGTEVHLIGPLQTNKTRQAMGLVSAIHSVDRPKLARRIADIAQETGRCPQLFAQVNTGEEPQKAGLLPGQADGFVAQLRAMDLPLAGLMCIPPIGEEPALHFALLAKIAARNGLAGLSMGMSADFETAIAFGATHIRVGAAIFGDRPKPAARSDAPAGSAGM